MHKGRVDFATAFGRLARPHLATVLRVSTACMWMHVDRYIYYTALLNVGGGGMAAHGTRIAMQEIEPCTCAYMLNKRGSGALGAWTENHQLMHHIYIYIYIYTHPLENCIRPSASGRSISQLPFADGYRWYAIKFCCDLFSATIHARMQFFHLRSTIVPSRVLSLLPISMSGLTCFVSPYAAHGAWGPGLARGAGSMENPDTSN